MTFVWRPRMTIRSPSDRKRRQCTGKRLSRILVVLSTRKGMQHLCDSTVAGPGARRDNVLASKCQYPPFRYPPLLKPARKVSCNKYRQYFFKTKKRYVIILSPMVSQPLWHLCFLPVSRGIGHYPLARRRHCYERNLGDLASKILIRTRSTTTRDKNLQFRLHWIC